MLVLVPETVEPVGLTVAGGPLVTEEELPPPEPHAANAAVIAITTKVGRVERRWRMPVRRFVQTAQFPSL